MGTRSAVAEARPAVGGLSLAARLFLAQILLVLIICAALSITSYVKTTAMVRDATGTRMLSLAETLANDPFVIDSVQDADPTARLQPYALRVMKSARADFITIMDRDRTRYTHPNPKELGKPYIGSIAAALDGRSQVEQYTGTLGPSVRAIAPIFDDTGGITAMVAVGVTVETLSVAQAAALPQILIVALAAIALGGLGAWLVSRYLRRVTLGYGPEQLRRLFVYYDSALHSLREGLVLVDGTGRLVLYNDQAAALLGLPPTGESETTTVDSLDLPASLRALFASGRVVEDELHVTRDRILVVNQQRAAQPEGRGVRFSRGRRAAQSLGTVTTLRDRTEIQALTGELESMRSLSEALRAQTHEHANRMHTVATLIELGREREALDLAVRDEQGSQRLTDEFVQALDEPFVTALLVGKAAQAHERGIRLVISAQGSLPKNALDALDLVTVTGNLLDNAFDAAAGSAERTVWADFSAAGEVLVISIADSGPGLDETSIDDILRLGGTTKTADAALGGHGLGLALVRQAVSRLGGTLEADSDGGAIFTVTIPLVARAGSTDDER
ncbi:Sensor histidine kinase regulating citrate/malate metabolism [Paramicrobacterium humi]|uniref:histidine kinase n=1 Tax=Paramicrobacterium humi TaxID=640635 RepID=A0A1H4IWU9_9MICO|nr:sensor histidine kinase [Microbacterium humi]SEB38325.1 Sensor histidine kinase regulating citrate/malate metabolism [Microbacterium humi]